MVFIVLRIRGMDSEGYPVGKIVTAIFFLSNLRQIHNSVTWKQARSCFLSASKSLERFWAIRNAIKFIFISDM